MQSNTDCTSSFFCVDCKAQYKSASTLLKHFAQHISYPKDEFTHENLQHAATHAVGIKQNHALSTIVLQSENEKKAESILERVLRQSPNNHNFDTNAHYALESMSIDSSTISEHDTCTSDNKYLSEEECQLPLTSLHAGDTVDASADNIMLVKFDLQKRLENCIFKLVSKRDSNSEIAPKSLEMNPDVSSTSQNMESSDIVTSQELTVTLTRNNTDLDDFNPLKFCLVTMDDEQGKLESEETQLNDSDQFLKSRRLSSNRKQRSPKKINCHVDDKAETLMGALTIEAVEKKPLQPKKKYPCQICWKIFGWSTDLKRHIITHTGERPFCCQKCPANFTRNFLLQKHELKVHPSVSMSNIVIDKITTVNTNHCKEESPTTKPVIEHSSPSKRKRKIQRILDEKQTVKNLEKKLHNLNRCNSISYEVFTHKALDIS